MISRESLRKRRQKGIRLGKLCSFDKASLTPKVIGKIGTTPCPCSCVCCGNPRHFFKNSKSALTKSELISLLESKEWQTDDGLFYYYE